MKLKANVSQNKLRSYYDSILNNHLGGFQYSALYEFANNILGEHTALVSGNTLITGKAFSSFTSIKRNEYGAYFFLEYSLIFPLLCLSLFERSEWFYSLRGACLSVASREETERRGELLSLSARFGISLAQCKLLALQNRRAIHSYQPVGLYVKFKNGEKSLSTPFIIFESSRGPLLIAISTFMFIAGLRLTLISGSLLYQGMFAFMTLLYFKFSGLNDLQKESNEGGFTIRVTKNIITGFKVFLFSEIMIFFSCFGAFIHFALLPNSFVLMNFPPKGIVALRAIGVPFANVCILVYSSLPLQASLLGIKRGVKSRTLECLAQVIACGILFLYLQLKE